MGSHGYHEIIGIDANEPFPVICPAAPCPATYPEQLSRGDRGNASSRRDLLCAHCRQAQPALANTWTYFSEGEAPINALQIDLNHRFSSGLSLRGVYTWSKTIDDGDSLNATTSGGEPALGLESLQSCGRTRVGEFQRPECRRHQRECMRCLLDKSNRHCQKS